MKKCNKCQDIKPFSQFYQRNNGKYWGQCKLCVSMGRKEKGQNPSRHYKQGKTCIDCGKPITDVSIRCLSCAGFVHWRKVHPPTFRKCAFCHSEFQVQPSRTNIFCTFECYRRYVQQNAKGWYIHKGYIRLNIGILYHRYVMEQHLNRELDTNEEIHHKNGNTLDNRIENLQIMTKEEHTRLHKTGSVTPSEVRLKQSASAKRRYQKSHDTNS